MIFAIDVGNSSIKTGCFQGERLLFTGRCRSKPDPKRSTEDFLLYFQDLIEMHRAEIHAGFLTRDAERCQAGSHPGKPGSSAGPLRPEGAIVSSVVPEIMPELCGALKLLSGAEPVIADRSMISGFRMDKYDISLIGMHRLVDMTAAVAEHCTPVCVFDLGTATTMSVTDPEGSFLGGSITAGVQLTLDALAERASQLPKLKAEATEKLVGGNTRECMVNGAVIGCACMIDGTAERLSEELAAPGMPLVVTGGLSPYVLPWCRYPVHHEPNLTLRGLRQMYLTATGS